MLQKIQELKMKQALELEYMVRQILGQSFRNFLDFLHRDKSVRSEHKRFDMSGNYGFVENQKILDLFELPISTEENTDKKYLLVFYKGVPSLYEKKSSRIYVERDYAGWGTVEIIIDLIDYIFNKQK
jgi:hypothetical protein